MCDLVLEIFKWYKIQVNAILTDNTRLDWQLYKLQPFTLYRFQCNIRSYKSLTDLTKHELQRRCCLFLSALAILLYNALTDLGRSVIYALIDVSMYHSVLQESDMALENRLTSSQVRLQNERAPAEEKRSHTNPASMIVSKTYPHNNNLLHIT